MLYNLPEENRFGLELFISTLPNRLLDDVPLGGEDHDVLGGRGTYCIAEDRYIANSGSTYPNVVDIVYVDNSNDLVFLFSSDGRLLEPTE